MDTNVKVGLEKVEERDPGQIFIDFIWNEMEFLSNEWKVKLWEKYLEVDKLEFDRIIKTIKGDNL